MPNFQARNRPAASSRKVALLLRKLRLPKVGRSNSASPGAKVGSLPSETEAAPHGADGGSCVCMSRHSVDVSTPAVCLAPVPHELFDRIKRATTLHKLGEGVHTSPARLPLSMSAPARNGFRSGEEVPHAPGGTCRTILSPSSAVPTAARPAKAFQGRGPALAVVCDMAEGSLGVYEGDGERKDHLDWYRWRAGASSGPENPSLCPHAKSTSTTSGRYDLIRNTKFACNELRCCKLHLVLPVLTFQFFQRAFCA